MRLVLAGVAALVLLIAIYFATRPKPAPVILGAESRSIALSENGKLLAIATKDGVLRLVAIDSGHTLARTLLPAPASAVTFGPDGAVLVLIGNRLMIFSSDLTAHSERETQPNATDMIWSPALEEAIVASGGADNLHPSLEFFPSRPMGLAQSTSELVDLVQWAAPVDLAASANGLIIGVTLNTNRRANVIFYDTKLHRVTGSSLVEGRPEGIALASDGDRAWVASPAAETVTEITARAVARTEYPKSASTSPLRMIAVNEAARHAYTTGALTFPEVDLDQHRIARTFELPTNSAEIVLSADRGTAYLTFKDANKIGVLSLQDMSSYREIKIR
jgi:DNA-binding beta-propeller fold protein YncE